MKLWSFQVAQNGRRRITVEGIGSGLYVPEARQILEADPEGCEEALLEWLVDEQEAQSVRYGSGTIIVVPLRSGRFAAFGIDRQLLAISRDAPTAEELRTWSKEGYERVKQAQEALSGGSQMRVSGSQATAEELGL